MDNDKYDELARTLRRHLRIIGDEIRLWCEVGGHDWRRPYDPAWDLGRASYDESCPEHDGLPLSGGLYPSIPSGSVLPIEDWPGTTPVGVE